MSTPNDSSAGPLVTIAIPTYNRAGRFLPAALAAACAQTYENLEILVSDNASPDQTRDVVASFADARIRYHRHAENIGAERNFNFCIENARGAYLQLLMDDDSIDRDFIAGCMQAARANPDAGVIRTGTRVLDGRGALLYETPNLVSGLSFADFVIAWTQGKTVPFLCSTVFRTAPLRDIGMHSRNFLWCDVLTELRLAARFGRVDVADVKASFCLHDGELTVGAAIEAWCDDSMQLVDTVCELAPREAALLRTHLMRFMASHNYRIALRLRKPWPDRLRGCLKVKRVFGEPPLANEVAREILQRAAWWNLARDARRSVRQLTGF